LTGGVWAGLLSRETPTSSGCRRFSHRRKATLLAALPRVAGGPCAVAEPRHVRRAPCARTGRSRGRPCATTDAPSGMVRGVVDRGSRAARGTLRRYALDARPREVRQARSTCEPAEQARGTGGGGGGGKGPARGEHGQANTSRTQSRIWRVKRTGSCAPDRRGGWSGRQNPREEPSALTRMLGSVRGPLVTAVPTGAPGMISSSGVQVPCGGDDTNRKPRATASS
jgi:hypothetical protein